MVTSGRTSIEALTQDASAYRLQPASVGLSPFEVRGKKVLDVSFATGVDLPRGAYAEAESVAASTLICGSQGGDSVRRWLL